MRKGGRGKERSVRAGCLAARDTEAVQRNACGLGPVGAAGALRRAAARSVVVQVDAAGGVPAIPHNNLARGVVDWRAGAVAVSRLPDDVGLACRIDVGELPAADGAGIYDSRGGEDGRGKVLHVNIFRFLFAVMLG